jgi:hypothetical protein
VFILLGIFFCASSCNKSKAKITSKAIYYWKTIYKVNQDEILFLKNNTIKKQYIRFFDVDLDVHSHQPMPVSAIRFLEKPLGQIVPTIFITNAVFKNEIALDTLAKNVVVKIRDIASEKELEFSEIQIDCDWTESTKNAYFIFLKKVKTYAQTDLSVTIRLHQIKFRKKTGIPPADKGVLMIYNTGNWRTMNKSNSLFDAQDILPYLTNLGSYPLELSFALPIYEQNLLYRNGRFHRFMNEFKFAPKERIFSADTTINGNSVRTGDVLRHEKPVFEELMYIKNEILQGLKKPKTEIILFHLDQKNINNYSNEQIKNLLD